MTDAITEEDWKKLIERVEEGECTPFLGAGVNHPLLPTGAQIARSWAEKYDYPLPDDNDLARVAQFLSLTGPDKLQPKELIREIIEDDIRKVFRAAKPPDFRAPHHHLGILAALPLPVYITTNYDDLLFRAMRANQKEPNLELCPWNVLLKKSSCADYPSSASSKIETLDVSQFVRSRLSERTGYSPTTANPLIYHLHGHYKNVDSMVLTENDYLDFLVQMSRNQRLLPLRITKALTQSSLLFIGYSLNDPNFRVLFRGLIHPLAENRRLSVAIQLVPGDVVKRNQIAARNYLAKYFEDINIKIFWGPAEDFVKTLWERWNNR